jgi:GNAT superfamily N-acetyltransferase
MTPVAIEIKAVSGMEQLERWVAVQNEVLPDAPETASMKALIRAQESGHVDLLAYLDGEPVGTGMLADDRESQSSGRPWVEVNVLPERRGRGVGAALLCDLSSNARDRGATGLACKVRADDAYSLAFLTRRGFVEYGRFERCTLDLASGPLPDAVVPDGVELAWVGDRPSLLDGMYAVAVGTYPELGGHRARQAESLIDWQVYELGSPNTLLDIVPVAVAGDQVVGFATMRTFPDGHTGEVRTVVVLPEWRRRGVASALLCAQLARARDTGMARVIVRVRHSWPVDLFRTLGFDVADGNILLHGPLI